VAGETLFLVMDSTHNMKNFYNNWLSRKTFIVPPSDLLGTSSSLSSTFSHVSALYALEEAKILKVAHRLRKSALNPSNIQKTCPQLALCK